MPVIGLLIRSPKGQTRRNKRTVGPRAGLTLPNAFFSAQRGVREPSRLIRVTIMTPGTPFTEVAIPCMTLFVIPCVRTSAELDRRPERNIREGNTLLLQSPPRSCCRESFCDVSFVIIASHKSPSKLLLLAPQSPLFYIYQRLPYREVTRVPVSGHHIVV